MMVSLRVCGSTTMLAGMAGADGGTGAYQCAGQDQAVNAVADAVLRSRAGLASRTRGSSFLFLGPTGVGKTELAKALAELLFDDEKMMVRVDMSEYMEVQQLSQPTCWMNCPSC